MDPNEIPKRPKNERLAHSFLRINIFLFIISFAAIAAVLVASFNSVANLLISKYSEKYAAVSAETLSAYIKKEIGLMSAAARSESVISWFLDEFNEEKKERALSDLSGIVNELYSGNLYSGFESSRNRYNVTYNTLMHDFMPFYTLSPNNEEDGWYFECINSEREYLINAAIDKLTPRKRVWLNFKVEHNGVLLGVIGTGLEITHIARDLFATYDNETMRGFVVDSEGFIKIDSRMMTDGVLAYEEAEEPFETALSDAQAISAIRSHIDGGGYYDEDAQGETFGISSGQFNFMYIKPIKYTDWSLIVLSGHSTVVRMPMFIPATALVLITLIAFVIAASFTAYRLIFRPLGKLDESLLVLKENREARIYGLERKDELGELARTIRDLFTQANVDALTCIYNRRYMESSMLYLMQLLARSGDCLSVFMVDIDFFKQYNDTYGHDQGDVCLRTVAQTLSACTARATDFAARYGGEEFVAVLPHTDAAGAKIIAEKLIESVRALKITHASSKAAPYVTVSVGITSGRVRHEQTWREYVSRADEALYSSKQNGRDQFTYVDFDA